VKREKKKSSRVSLHLAEPEVSLGGRLQQMFAQRPILQGIGIGVSICALFGAVMLVSSWRGRQVKGIEELQEGMRLLQNGDATLAASKLELAEQYLEGGEESYLTQLALFKLGNIEEKKGNLPEARRQYEASVDMDGPLKAESLLAVARVLALAKDDSLAVSYYRKFLEQYPDFPMSEIVRQKMGEG